MKNQGFQYMSMADFRYVAQSSQISGKAWQTLGSFQGKFGNQFGVGIISGAVLIAVTESQKIDNNNATMGWGWG